VVTLAHPYLLALHLPFSSYLLPCAWTKKKRGVKVGEDKKKEKGNTKKYQSPEGATLASFLSHGRVGLDSFHRHAKPSAKTREAWVYGSGGA
jgi:hypothetical protein